MCVSIVVLQIHQSGGEGPRDQRRYATPVDVSRFRQERTHELLTMTVHWVKNRKKDQNEELGASPTLTTKL
jgi:hypothetical protein